jgi:hypothetical protein
MSVLTATMAQATASPEVIVLDGQDRGLNDVAPGEVLSLSQDYRIDPALNERYAPSPAHRPEPVPFCLDDPWPDDPGLTPTAYDLHESNGTAKFPLPIIAAFRPITFEQVGFATRIKDASEILRYADWNHEQFGPKLFARGAIYPAVCFVNSFSADEWAMIEGLGQSVARMTKTRCGQAVRPVTTLMNAISPLRIIHRLGEIHGKAMTIFEVGPGMAYVGPMLAKVGHRYRCFDVTQAFCLWQHHMLRWAVGEDFEEMIGKPADSPIPSEKAVVNLPWWRYVDFLFGETIPADVVYSTGNLCEMTHDARQCVLQVSHRMLASSPIGVLFYIGPGAVAQCSVDQLFDEIRANGFHRVDGVPFACWTARQETAGAIAFAFRGGIPLFNPSKRSEIYPADIVMRIPRSEAPVDVPYTKWRLGWEPSYLD